MKSKGSKQKAFKEKRGTKTQVPQSFLWEIIDEFWSDPCWQQPPGPLG